MAKYKKRLIFGGLSLIAGWFLVSSYLDGLPREYVVNGNHFRVPAIAVHGERRGGEVSMFSTYGMLPDFEDWSYSIKPRYLRSNPKVVDIYIGVSRTDWDSVEKRRNLAREDAEKRGSKPIKNTELGLEIYEYSRGSRDVRIPLVPFDEPIVIGCFENVDAVISECRGVLDRGEYYVHFDFDPEHLSQWRHVASRVVEYINSISIGEGGDGAPDVGK